MTPGKIKSLLGSRRWTRWITTHRGAVPTTPVQRRWPQLLGIASLDAGTPTTSVWLDCPALELLFCSGVNKSHQTSTQKVARPEGKDAILLFFHDKKMQLGPYWNQHREKDISQHGTLLKCIATQDVWILLQLCQETNRGCSPAFCHRNSMNHGQEAEDREGPAACSLMLRFRRSWKKDWKKKERCSELMNQKGEEPARSDWNLCRFFAHFRRPCHVWETCMRCML